jgi:hypothetical protein
MKTTQEGSISTLPPSQAGERLRNPDLAFWKPYQGKGAALIFEYSPQKNTFFMQMLPEKPENTEDSKKYDKDRRISAKLGLSDLGEILAVIKGRKGGAGTEAEGKFKGLYHKNQNGNTIIGFDRTDKGIRTGLSVKSDKIELRLNVNLSVGEATLLENFIETYLPYMFVSEN